MSTAKEPQYWLIKSEGDCYSIDDLKRDKKTGWTGIRNYQARNFMRDLMKVGDFALFYHSSSKNVNAPTGIYGLAQVCSKPYPDPTAKDKDDEHYEPKSDWVMVDVKFLKKYKNSMSLQQIKIDPALSGMLVSQRGSRLSIQPVSEKHFTYITQKIDM